MWDDAIFVDDMVAPSANGSEPMEIDNDGKSLLSSNTAGNIQEANQEGSSMVASRARRQSVSCFAVGFSVFSDDFHSHFCHFVALCTTNSDPSELAQWEFGSTYDGPVRILSFPRSQQEKL